MLTLKVNTTSRNPRATFYKT